MLKILATIFGILMSVGYYIQAYKMWKNKTAEGVSLLTFLIFGVGTTIWTLYGISINDPVIIAGFSLGMLGSWIVVSLILRFRAN